MIREGFLIIGPHQGYYGRAEYDQEAKLFHGQVIGTRDVITFQGRSTTELEQAFPESIDDYLAFCESRGESPEKPYSGKFVVRMDPEVHRRASVLATYRGISLNQLVVECVEQLCETQTPTQKPLENAGVAQFQVESSQSSALE